MWIVPIIAGLSYGLGGDGRIPYLFISGFNAKLWRWLMGIPIVVVGLLTGHGLTSLWCILTYYIATNIPYGENSPLNFLGEYGKYIVCGIAFGLASAPILLYWSIVQAIIGGIGFAILHWFDEMNIIKNPFQEIFRGIVGTIVFIFI